MSIIALAIRMAATRALETEGATLAGARVFDSAITPLDEMVSAEPKPLIVVSTEDDSAEALSSPRLKLALQRSKQALARAMEAINDV